MIRAVSEPSLARYADHVASLAQNVVHHLIRGTAVRAGFVSERGVHVAKMRVAHAADESALPVHARVRREGTRVAEHAFALRVDAAETRADDVIHHLVLVDLGDRLRSSIAIRAAQRADGIRRVVVRFAPPTVVADTRRADAAQTPTLRDEAAGEAAHCGDATHADDRLRSVQLRASERNLLANQLAQRDVVDGREQVAAARVAVPFVCDGVVLLLPALTVVVVIVFVFAHRRWVGPLRSRNSGVEEVRGDRSVVSRDPDAMQLKVQPEPPNAPQNRATYEALILRLRTPHRSGVRREDGVFATTVLARREADSFGTGSGTRLRPTNP